MKCNSAQLFKMKRVPESTPFSVSYNARRSVGLDSYMLSGALFCETFRGLSH